MASSIDAFERRFSAAALRTINGETWDLFIRTINARLKGVEEKKAEFEAAEQVLVQLGLQRINDALLPAFQTISGLAHLGAMLTAASTTTLDVGEGQKQLTIAEADRERFAPAAYLAIRASGATSPVMTGTLVDYHRESGTLTVSVDYSVGDGPHASWVISPTINEAIARRIVTLTQQDYDALDPPDSNTLYFITDAGP